MLTLIEQSILMTQCNLINLLLFSQYCFHSHFTSQYPQLRCLSTQPLYSHQHICFLYHLLIFHNKKTSFKLAILYDNSIADAHPSFLLEEAILFYLHLENSHGRKIDGSYMMDGWYHGLFCVLLFMYYANIILFFSKTKQNKANP